MSKVALVMIVRDAAATLRECLESVRPHVDYVCILDTGSTDDSPAIAQEFADRWERWTDCNIDPRTGQPTDVIWDFSAARNKSWELIPDECEVAFWLDADDRLHDGEHLRAMAASMPDGHSAFLVPYEYSYDNAGRPTCIHWRERLLKPARDFVWTTPCHEVCLPRSPVPMQTLQGGQVLIKHRAQAAAAIPGAKPREVGRNLRILQAYLQRVHEGDPRAMYYTGVEYARHGQYGKARDVLKRYCQLSNWDDERCLAELELARIYLHEGECKEAIRWAMQAMTTKDWPNPYWLLVQAFFRMAVEGPDARHEYNLARAVAWAARGRDLKDAETVLFYDPTERYTTDRTVARILAHWGEIDHAAEACRRGLAGIPGDPDLMQQLKAYEKVRIGRDIDTALSRLVHLGALEERARAAIEAIVKGELVVAANDTAAQAGPGPFARIGTGEAVDMSSLPAVPDGKLDIVIVTGPAMEDWTPKTIEETGIGGSETMAWEMARGLAKLGHRVRHYGWCRPEQEGVFEGVHWFDSARYRDIECDVLVVSRYADLIAAVGGVKAKARVLWTHDVVPHNMTPQHALRFDRVLCLSKWHKEFVCKTHPFLDPDRVTVTRNGIDLTLFSDTPERNPLRAVFSSSPDRGLQTALELWPLIRAEVPEAELNVFYGFDGLRRIQPALADALEAKAKATAGVVLHGRINPRELAQEFLKSGVLFYPTWFQETFMIGAAQAQAAGLRIVTSPIAALNETVGTNRGVMVDGAPGPIDMATRGFELHPPSPEYRSACVRAVVRALTEPSGQGEREAIQYVARERFGLGPLAEAWSNMLAELCEAQEMPRFYVDPAMAAVARETDEAA